MYPLFVITMAAFMAAISLQPAGVARESTAGGTLKLTPCDPVPESRFGYSVATDGITTAVSALGTLLGGPSRVCVYEGSPTATAVLLATQVLPDDIFGIDLAVAGDTIVVSGRRTYVYRRLSAGTWVEELVIPLLSLHVALTRTTLAIASGGQVHIYGRDAQGLWSSTETLTAPLDYLGTALDLEGDLLLVGADESAHVYRQGADGWQLIASLSSDSDCSSGYFNECGFGTDVALWRGIAYVGGWAYGNGESGAVLVFAPRGDQWSLVTKILPRKDDWGQSFGSSFCTNSKGLFIAAPNRDTRFAEASGVVYHYERAGLADAWELVQELVPDPQAFASFGFSMSCGPDVVVVGAIDADSGGAAYCIDV